ncbi:MAG: hypothetical protein ACSHW1_15125 [Yoonia sp.]|uniref:hypothetical protein n=1 Tax=Yoonia sp. TaxID=2212373 RepID=UPI003EF88DD3
MKPVKKPPVFLQRQNYRQRRFRDAARLLPFAGVVLWAIPMSWPDADQGRGVSSAGVVYIFGVWVLLIILTAALARRLRSDVPDNADGDDDTGGGT